MAGLTGAAIHVRDASDLEALNDPRVLGRQAVRCDLCDPDRRRAFCGLGAERDAELALLLEDDAEHLGRCPRCALLLRATGAHSADWHSAGTVTFVRQSRSAKGEAAQVAKQHVKASQASRI